MSTPAEQTIIDLRDLEQRARKSGKFAWRMAPLFEWLDNGLVLLSALTAGAAGLTAALNEPRGVTATIAFISAALATIALPVRFKRQYNVVAAAICKDVAWRADHAVKYDPDPDSRRATLAHLQDRLFEYDRTPAP